MCHFLEYYKKKSRSINKNVKGEKGIYTTANKPHGKHWRHIRQGSQCFRGKFTKTNTNVKLPPWTD